MKKKMKWFVIILCVVVLAASASKFSSKDSGETKQIVADGKTETADSKKDDNTELQAEASQEKTAKTNDAVTIDEQVLVDESQIVITATEYVTDSIWGDGIKLLLENNSDKDVMVGCSALIVNDYMITDLFASEVAAGKKANKTLYLSNGELKAAGIETVGKIEIYFHAYDSASYDNIFDTDCITIRTSGYENMDTAPNDAGMELYNEGGIRIVGKTVDENSFWGTAILLYCENTSGQNVGISVDDLSVNGFMMNPFFSTIIYDGKKSIDDITIFSSDLEENGIQSVENVELKFHIYNADSYSDIADTEPINFSAQ